MNLLDKYNLKLEDRFNIIPFETRVKINSNFFDKFKERGDIKKLFKDHPRLIDENGNRTEKLVILGDTRDGHVIESGEDEKGRYHIFQAKKTDLEKIKGMAIAKDKMVKMSFLNKLQIDYVKPGIELDELEKIEKEIDALFVDIFDLNDKKINEPSKKTPLWLSVGVHFAKGEIEKLYKNDKNSFSQIAKKLGNENYRPYISESYNNTNTNNKNIFSDEKKIKTIIEYCNDNEIEIIDSFTTKINLSK